ncbi:MAG: ABC transporter substrate-binding protein [Pseudomonadota bacterium]
MRWLITTLVVYALAGGLASAQERVVSIGGDLTEIIYLLGEEDRLVATDTTSVYPQAALETPKVGYVRRLSAEGVLSVEPDMILVSGAAGPEPAVEQLEASGVKMISLPTEYTPASILRKIDVVSKALGVPEKGAALRMQVEADIARAEATIEQLDIAPRILFFTSSAGAPRSAGTETAAHGVILMLNGVNVFGNQTGYRALSLEAAVTADPDVILVMGHSAARLGGVEGLKEHPALALTNAAKQDRIIAIDAAKTMQFGPRTPEAIAEVAAELAAVLN